MREHIYRGQRLDTGEWVEGSAITASDGSCAITFELKGEDWDAEQVSPLTLGEFSSEFDVAGRRIFEDDVCVDALGDKWVIIFKKAAFMARGLESGVYWRNLDGSKLTVVGNIHDDKKGWL